MNYRKISFVRFALAGVVILVPAILLEQSEQRGWAWSYTVLILIMLVVFYSGPLTKAAKFFNSKLAKE